MNRKPYRTSLLPFIILLVSTLVAVRCTSRGSAHNEAAPLVMDQQNGTLEHATFAMGCFWHSEEMFLEIKGVHDAIPGYAGGTTPSPTYEEVGSGETGYAESVEVTFDPTVISYQQLLDVFFKEHDPTSLNRQGPDVGSQYRSAVFYHTPAQKQAIETYLARAKAKYPRPIVTDVAPFTKFYKAEDYHQRYVRNHPDQPYVANVTIPELNQFKRDFPDLLK
jgi:peptide-methionine (S)-S-oxide reductase